MSDPLLSVENATKRFRTAGHEVVALADVSLAVEPGECHAIIGESGSGKSTLAGLILGLTQPSSGSIRFKGETLGARRRPLRLKRAIQLIQQNPLSALNGRRTVGQSIRLGLDVHRLGERSRRRERVAELLAEVGLPADYAARTPRGLSGGERQRVAIARALACEPELLVLDEPTSALDVLVQARVLNLLMRTRREHGLTFSSSRTTSPLSAASPTASACSNGGGWSRRVRPTRSSRRRAMPIRAGSSAPFRL